jgi:hypothetical protein
MRETRSATRLPMMERPRGGRQHEAGQKDRPRQRLAVLALEPFEPLECKDTRVNASVER